METSLKAGFAQIFSCRPKKSELPKIWGGGGGGGGGAGGGGGGGGAPPPLAAPPPPPVRLWEN